MHTVVEDKTLTLGTLNTLLLLQVPNTEEEDAKIKAERELFGWLTDHVHGLHPDNAYKYSKIFYAKFTTIQKVARKVEKKSMYLTDELEIDEDDADDIIEAMKTAGTVQYKHQHYSYYFIYIRMDTSTSNHYFDAIHHIHTFLLVHYLFYLLRNVDDREILL